MSRKKRAQSEDQHPEPSADVEALVYDAMGQLGWVVPQTDEAVRRAETRLAAHPVRLPEQLTRPPNILTGGAAAPLPRAMNRGTQSTEVEQNLARAAREGEEIPPELEARMRHDREAAEREADRHESDNSDE